MDEDAAARAVRFGLRCGRAAAAGLGLSMSACIASPPPSPSPSTVAAGAAAPTLRQRIAAVALRQTAFGALSVLPVRFEHSRLAGPFEDGGRTLYCVTTRMTGRSFGRAERPKAVIRDEGGVLRALDEGEVCEGHRTEPFPELDAIGTASG